MAAENLTITIPLRWWLPIYLNTLIWIALMTGLEPNWERVSVWILRGMILPRAPAARKAIDRYRTVKP